jgi:hypothetical protein
MYAYIQPNTGLAAVLTQLHQEIGSIRAEAKMRQERELMLQRELAAIKVHFAYVYNYSAKKVHVHICA